MKRRFAELQGIDNDHEITAMTDAAFCYHLQNALLLSLKEQGILTDVQYRTAVGKLKSQFKTVVP